jgi:WD40 repeat protein
LRAVPSGESLFALRPEETAGELTALAAQPGGERLATAHADSTVRIWDLDICKLERSFPLASEPTQVFHLAFTPEGRYLAAALADGTVLLLRIGDADLVSGASPGAGGMEHLEPTAE